MGYKQTLRNSGAKFIHDTNRYGPKWLRYPKPSFNRHKSEECDSFGWQSYDEADEYGRKVIGGDQYTVTACQFCGKWHCKRGTPRPTGIIREGGK